MPIASTILLTQVPAQNAQNEPVVNRLTKCLYIWILHFHYVSNLFVYDCLIDVLSFSTENLLI